MQEPCLWYDLTSLAQHDGTAKGVQRAAAGLAIGLRDAQAGRPIRFCRFDRTRGFLALDDADVDRLLDRLQRGAERGIDPRRAVEWIRRRIQRQPSFRAPFAPGDALFNPGFATYKRHHAEIAGLLERAGVRYVGFIYDLLPVLFPEWWRPDQQSRYRDWFSWTGRHAALVLCCSLSTSRDAQRFFSEAQIAAGPIETVRLGDELPSGLAAARRARRAANAAARPFVLFVSTLEVRKNHRLLFQVWRRLLAAHGRERVPDLVFVGKRGWLIDDFATELAQSRYLDGRIIWHERVDDA
ncbi:MAG: hypothetical protein E6J87_10635, partial [Deltaproteobacteria bacterium]